MAYVTLTESEPPTGSEDTDPDFEAHHEEFLCLIDADERIEPTASPTVSCPEFQ